MLRTAMQRLNARKFQEQWSFLSAHPVFRTDAPGVLRRLAQWRILTALRRPCHVAIDRWNLLLEVPAQWRGPGKVLFLFREHYDDQLVHLGVFLATGDVFIDVGANLGIYALAASRLVGPTGSVLAIEPASETFARLERNIERNDAAHVTPLHLAIADHHGTLDLNMHIDDSRISLRLPGADSAGRDSERVAVRTLDAVLSANHIDHVDVIKIDVEGAEELVFRGAIESIRRWHPTILFEVNGPAATAMGLDTNYPFTCLREHGYVISTMSPDGTLQPVLTSPPVANYVATFPAAEPERRLADGPRRT